MTGEWWWDATVIALLGLCISLVGVGFQLWTHRKSRRLRLKVSCDTGFPPLMNTISIHLLKVENHGQVAVSFGGKWCTRLEEKSTGEVFEVPWLGEGWKPRTLNHGESLEAQFLGQSIVTMLYQRIGAGDHRVRIVLTDGLSREHRTKWLSFFVGHPDDEKSKKIQATREFRAKYPRLKPNHYYR